MIICKNCGRENEDEYKFCLGCGSALPKKEEAPAEQAAPKMIDCPHCGTTVPSNFKFCGACGGAISAQNPPQAQRAQQAPANEAEPQAEPAAQPEPEPEPVAAPTPAGQAATSATDDIVGRLIVIRPDGSEGAEIALTDGEHTVGRDSQKKALSNDPFLSPVHATFSFTGDGFRVRDEDSLNGVFVRIRDKIELTHGDFIRMGQELLRFELMDEANPVLARTEEKTQIAGSPDEKYWGRLCLIAGPDLVSRAFALEGEGVTIGRETGDILFRDDGFVSGRHARVGRDGETPVLEDLGSSNGTYRRIRQETRVDDGDLLLMGQQLFRLVVV